MFPCKFVRSRSEGNKNISLETNMAHTNEVFDINTELPDNPLYLSSQPVDELGYSSDQEKQHDLPPTDSKRKLKFSQTMTFLLTINLLIIMNLQYRCMHFQKKVKYKRLRSVLETFMRMCVNQTEALRKVRYENMKVEKDAAVAKLSNTDDKDELTKSTCYADIKCP